MKLIDTLWNDEGGYVYGIEVKEGNIAAGGAGKDVRIYKRRKEVGRISGDNPWYSVDWDRGAKKVAMAGTGGELYEFFYNLWFIFNIKY